MPLTSRIALLAGAVLAAGCIDTATPVALNLGLNTQYTPGANGSCTGVVEVVATGTGTAQWRRVTLSRGGVAQDDYVGDATAGFWGGVSSVSAGEIRRSVPIPLAAATTYSLVLRYGIAGNEREVSLSMDCATAG